MFEELRVGFEQNTEKFVLSDSNVYLINTGDMNNFKYDYFSLVSPNSFSTEALVFAMNFLQQHNYNYYCYRRQKDEVTIEDYFNMLVNNQRSYVVKIIQLRKQYPFNGIFSIDFYRNRRKIKALMVVNEIEKCREFVTFMDNIELELQRRNARNEEVFLEYLSWKRGITG